MSLLPVRFSCHTIMAFDDACFIHEKVLSTLNDNKCTLTLKRANISAPLFLRNSLLISETTRQGFFHLDSGQFSVNRLKVLPFFSKLFVQKIPKWQQCLAITNFEKQFHGYEYQKGILQKLSFLVNFIFFQKKIVKTVIFSANWPKIYFAEKISFNLWSHFHAVGAPQRTLWTSMWEL